MTRAEIDRLAETRRDPPPRFTGVWRGQHYYRGAEWTGATNTIGRR